MAQKSFIRFLLRIGPSRILRRVADLPPSPRHPRSCEESVRRALRIIRPLKESELAVHLQTGRDLKERMPSWRPRDGGWWRWLKWATIIFSATVGLRLSSYSFGGGVSFSL